MHSGLHTSAQEHFSGSLFKKPLSISRQQFTALAPLALLAGKLWSRAADHWNIKGESSECLAGCQRPWNADESIWLEQSAEERSFNRDRMEGWRTERRAEQIQRHSLYRTSCSAPNYHSCLSVTVHFSFRMQTRAEANMSWQGCWRGSERH